MARPDPHLDELLMTLAARHEDVQGMLQTFFSFLHRRTDLYVVDERPSRPIGFAPGVAEKLVRSRHAVGLVHAVYTCFTPLLEDDRCAATRCWTSVLACADATRISFLRVQAPRGR